MSATEGTQQCEPGSVLACELCCLINFVRDHHQFIGGLLAADPIAQEYLTGAEKAYAKLWHHVTAR
ncbi:hypothetical protein ACWCPS_00295 [Streptomyces mauvecolor]